MLDCARLNQLKSDIGAQELTALIPVFLQEAEETLVKLQTCAPSETRAHLHFLKGCAANIGFTALADYCESHKTNPDNDALSALFTASRHALNSKMKDLDS